VHRESTNNSFGNSINYRFAEVVSEEGLLFSGWLFLGDCLFAGAVTLVEALNATCGVDDLHLTGEERVACIRNFKLHNWVRLTIFPDRGLGGVRLHGAAGQKAVVG